MNVFAFLKSLQHHFILRDVGQQSQFQLGIVGRNDFISLFGDEGPPDAASQFCANGYVLEVRIAGRETSGGGHRLIKQTVNSAIRRDLMWKRVSVNAFKFVELTVLNDQSGQ